MAERFLCIWLPIAGCLLFLGANFGWALDEGGCLTCHQYPGLVRHEKTDGFKVLHIDEEKFGNSAHGKLPCARCHTTIAKVPHTGETRVDCTSGCHEGRNGKILPANYPLDDFHKQEQSYIIRLADQSSCRVCHPLYPHSDNRVVRALLNMHTGFALCEVCHIKRGQFKHLAYQWHDTENAEFSGAPFGTYFKPHSGEIPRDEHFISRIAVFASEKGETRALMNTWDTGKAKEFLRTEKGLNADEKKKKLDYFHRDIEKKEISVACDECHSTHSILDFDKLGFSKQKTNNLVYLNIKGLVTKYKTFYFPHLFGD
ncbi:MAG: hypothetical protein JSW39_04930 [Desulfobacterales bacterium]|nr:MAG: hypothetical protein JSW39_04930 [Desulfobacterales bacterium]